jgi:hypothetical protein
MPDHRKRKRTEKDQARFDAATQRAVEIAQDRRRRLEAERIARLEAERAEHLAQRPRVFDDFWTPWEITGSFYVLEYLAQWHAGQYGSPEVFN